MVSKYQPYDEYKDSGSEWLGDVPEHWSVKKLKFVCDLKTEKVSTEKKHVIALENIEGWSGRYIPTDSEYSGEDVSFAAGDILFGKLRPYLAKVYAAENRGVAFGDLLVYRPLKKILSLYGFYQMISEDFISIVDSSTYGSKMPRASSEFINEMLFLVPPLDEQSSIVAFLDHETAKLDGLIERQERLIGLLREKRQAVISHAVTKGLNPSAPLRPSGVEWLGDVPQHWGVKRLKYLSSFLGTGGTPKNDSSFTEENGINWFTPGDFKNDGSLMISSKFVTDLACRTGDAKFYQKNSILVIGIGATLGRVAYCEAAFSCNQQINVITPNERILTSFMVYSLSVQSEQMKQLSNSSTIGIMNQEKTKLICISCPDLSEQQEITAFLDHETAKIDGIIGRLERQITILKERRTALISAAVTGKIDVRSAGPHLFTQNHMVLSEFSRRRTLGLNL